jgi:hypothetical protein
MAVMGSFRGNCRGFNLKKIDGTLRVSSTGDISLELDDDTGAYKLKIRDKNGVDVGECDSNGDAIFNSVNVPLAYSADASAGSVAASFSLVPDALDGLFRGDHWEFNEESQSIPDNNRINFETAGKKEFHSGKIMVYLMGILQKPGDDYVENVNKYSIDFVVAPLIGDNITFTYLKA